METFRSIGRKISRQFQSSSIIIESNKNRSDRILLKFAGFSLPIHLAHLKLSSKNAANKKHERLPTCSSRLPANGCPRDRSLSRSTILASWSLFLFRAYSLQQDLAVSADTRVFAHVNARGRSHALKVMLSYEDVSLSLLGGPPMMIDHRFRHRRHRYPPKNRRTTHSKLALSLAGCTPRTSRREVDGFLAAKSRKRVFLPT